MKEFKAYLLQKNFTQNTINSYLFSIAHFKAIYKGLTKTNLLSFKAFLIKNYKPKTVNLRINGINKYLEFRGTPEMKLSQIKVQQKTFLENVISNADYQFLVSKLKAEKNWKWYFVVKFLACTGVRVSELVQLKVEHLKIGFFDLYSKGGKVRRIYIPSALLQESKKWFFASQKETGFFFLNRRGKPITTRGIAHQLKAFARRYKLNEKTVYPHSFRHRFAKNFLEKFNDLSLLADILGHESIETTRIYLRRTSTEQAQIINKVVTW